jgi:hypothetical protein
MAAIGIVLGILAGEGRTHNPALVLVQRPDRRVGQGGAALPVRLPAYRPRLEAQSKADTARRRFQDVDGCIRDFRADAVSFQHGQTDFVSAGHSLSVRTIDYASDEYGYELPAMWATGQPTATRGSKP